MKKFVMLAGLAAGVLLLAYGSAIADHTGASPCCAARASDGKACNELDPANPMTTGRGCAEIDATGACAGGDASRPAGCFCLYAIPQPGAPGGGIACFTGPGGGVTPERCTDAAVAACGADIH